MKKIFTACMVITLYGCSSYVVQDNELQENAAQEKAQLSSVTSAEVAPVCEGSVELPTHLADQFVKVQNADLLGESLGNPGKGKLCQGQVYQSKEGAQVVLYRAWNSTNPHSKMGKWWAFEQPSGKVAQYREEYEICYQWSPLDKLVRCTLEEGTTVVVGNGQSAQCSEYLTYSTSSTQQIFVTDANAALNNCTVLDGEFSWK